MKSSVVAPLYRVRRSKIHGTGAFAAADIRKGVRITEYLGDRISHAEADRRYADKHDDDNHTFLFTVNRRVVIDGGVGGNDARYINHSCDPNCETVIDDRRVYIEAIRDIRKGDELGYDYLIERDENDPPHVDLIWACRCGSPKCRGTMLLPPAPKRKKATKSKAADKTGRRKKKQGAPGKRGAGTGVSQTPPVRTVKKSSRKAVKKAGKKVSRASRKKSS